MKPYNKPINPIGRLLPGDFWWNYQTESFDYVEGPISTDEQAEKYIPQGIGGCGVMAYRIRRELGASIQEAMLGVLSAALGEKPE